MDNYNFFCFGIFTESMNKYIGENFENPKKLNDTNELKSIILNFFNQSNTETSEIIGPEYLQKFLNFLDDNADQINKILEKFSAPTDQSEQLKKVIYSKIFNSSKIKRVMFYKTKTGAPFDPGKKIKIQYNGIIKEWGTIWIFTIL